MNITGGQKFVLLIGIINVILFSLFFWQYGDLSNKIETIGVNCANQYIALEKLQIKVNKAVLAEKIQLLEEIQQDITGSEENAMIKYVPPVKEY